MIVYTEQETSTTFRVTTHVSPTLFGDIGIYREHTNPYAAETEAARFLLSPAAARQLVGALNEMLSLMEG